MNNGEVKKRNNSKKIIILLIFLIIFAGIIVLLVRLFEPKIVYISNGVETTGMDSLYCTTKSKNIPEAFFDVSDAENVSQVIRVIFENKKINNIFYNMSAVYKNTDDANKAEAQLHAKYGSYIQNENGKSMSILLPNFSVIDNEVKISLYADKDNLDEKIAKIFLIDTSGANLNNYSSKVLATLYKTKGFSCEEKE